MSTFARSIRSAPAGPEGTSTSTLSPVGPTAASGVGDTPDRCMAVWWISANARPIPSASSSGTRSWAAVTTATSALIVAAARG